VTDATGENTAAWGPVPIQTSNAPCNPNPRRDTANMKVRFATGKRDHMMKTRYGKRARVRGRLTNTEGEPIPNARICVSARPRAAGAALRADGRVKTNDKGRFSYKLKRGPSRDVHFVYRVGDGAVSDSVSVRVRAPVRFGASQRTLANGQAVTLRGRLRAGPYPKRGVVVELQAKRGSKWQSFGTTRTNRRGRYRFRYRFTRTTGVQNYSLRARVPRQSTYPYSNGASRPVTVRVVG
jgi:hypothetical protein